MWVLILYLNGSVALTAIPGSYSSLDSCKAAAKSFESQIPVFFARGICIPAPDDIYEMKE